MATYLMFGTYSPEAMQAVSSKRTDEAQAIIRQYGGEYKAGYALLGGVDLVVIVDLPDTEHALQASAALTKLLGISFRTAPAVSIEAFDKLMA
jgi:uncharacterized protein with GYD domain